MRVKPSDKQIQNIIMNMQIPAIIRCVDSADQHPNTLSDLPDPRRFFISIFQFLSAFIPLPKQSSFLERLPRHFTLDIPCGVKYGKHLRVLLDFPTIL